MQLLISEGSAGVAGNQPRKLVGTSWVWRSNRQPSAIHQFAAPVVSAPRRRPAVAPGIVIMPGAYGRPPAQPAAPGEESTGAKIKAQILKRQRGLTVDQAPLAGFAGSSPALCTNCLLP